MNINRTVLITGAAGGIGSVLVDRFLANDDDVVAIDTSQDVLDNWRTRWPQDARLVPVAADITSEADCERVAQVVRANTGRLDVLINCAGYFPIVAFENMTAQQFRQVVDINLTGTFLVTHAPEFVKVFETRAC